MMRMLVFRVSAVLVLCLTLHAEDRVPKWTRFEARFASSVEYPNPLETELRVAFRSPSGKLRTVYGFWDGGKTWRVRFAPNETGRWTFATECSDRRNRGLHAQRGNLLCTQPREGTSFEKHGPVRVSSDGRHFVYEDGTPFFWLADTAWNGPLLSTPDDWQLYIGKRAGQKFTAVQWVTTQWRGSPTGDAMGRPAYTGKDRIQVDPDFFRRLDAKTEALTRAGLLSVPVMLWAIASRSGSEINPGVSLPESQAILLARYMLARWGADPVVWILNGDGDYRGERAAKWKIIGRGAFGDVWHAPVSLHPGGRIWVMDDFRDEPWLDICGYQSSHNESDENSAWITTGPPAMEWTRKPARPVISLEGPYERAGQPAWDSVVRRNHMWSMLNAPVAGITYGVHGVWGWSDGVHPVAGHGPTVTPHWKSLLDLPAARQLGGIRGFFESIEYWLLRPAPSILATQPGAETPQRFVSTSQSESRDLTVVYVPQDRQVALKSSALPAGFDASWFSPATGQKTAAHAAREGDVTLFATPEPGDWVLLIRRKDQASK